MKFLLPKNAPDLILHIWKIIDLPSILMSDLFYTLSFELFLSPPEKAKLLINKAIQAKILTKDEKGNLSLSHNLEKRFNTWQKNRKETISSNLKKAKEIPQKIIASEGESGFNVLFKAFSDKGTINRAVTISSSAITIEKCDPIEGIIKATIAGKKEDSYIIDINVSDKQLSHDCHDYKTRRAEDKKFCKHLAKLFMILKTENEKDAEYFLNQIAENIDEWQFIGKD